VPDPDSTSCEEVDKDPNPKTNRPSIVIARESPSLLEGRPFAKKPQGGTWVCMLHAMCVHIQPFYSFFKF
jgi:hypothetical protein